MVRFSFGIFDRWKAVDRHNEFGPERGELGNGHLWEEVAADKKTLSRGESGVDGSFVECIPQASRHIVQRGYGHRELVNRRTYATRIIENELQEVRGVELRIAPQMAAAWSALPPKGYGLKREQICERLRIKLPGQT